MPRYRIADPDGRELGNANFATEIHEGDVIHWPKTERRVLTVTWDVIADSAVLTVEPE